MSKEVRKINTFRQDFPYLCVVAVIASFIGWIGENVAIFIGSGKMDSRFYLLPFISSYGLIVLFLYAALRDVDRATFFGKPLFKGDTLASKILSNLYCLVFITAAAFLGEIIVGTFWEKTCGVILWDYTNHPYCITRYTCLSNILLYGGAGYLIFRLGFSPLFRLIKKMPRKIAKIIGYTLGTLILADTAFMGIYTFVRKKAPVYWRIYLR